MPITIEIDERAYRLLTKAKKEEETLSDVIVRLASVTLEGLRRRGPVELRTSDGKRLLIEIRQEFCLGAMSCVAMAPKVFALDVTQLGLFRKSAEPLGVRELEPGEVDSETIILAAQSCPYQAIIVKDADTGQVLAP